MQERFILAQELNTTKDSARTIIKCLNASLKASSHIIARTIIEMIVHEHINSMNLTIGKLMEKFRRGKNYSVSDESSFYCDYNSFFFFF
jgi:hypothetical protein